MGSESASGWSSTAAQYISLLRIDFPAGGCAPVLPSTPPFPIRVFLV